MSSNDEEPKGRTPEKAGGPASAAEAGDPPPPVNGTTPKSDISHQYENDDTSANMNPNGVPSASDTDGQATAPDESGNGAAEGAQTPATGEARDDAPLSAEPEAAASAPAGTESAEAEATKTAATETGVAGTEAAPPAPEEAVSEGIEPEAPASDGTASGSTASQSPLSEAAVSDSTVSTMSQSTVSEATVAEATAPGTSVPETGADDLPYEPDATREESVVPDEAVPHAAAAAGLPEGERPAEQVSAAGHGDAGETAALPADAAASGSPAPPAGGPGGPGGGNGGGRAGRNGKERSRRARFGRRALFGVLGFIGFCVLAFGIAYLLTPVPSPQEQAVAQGPSFYYADGETLIAKTGINRDAVPIDKIPEGVRDAVIAAENQSFYEDPGVSVRGTFRAFWSTATGEQLQGGSTITQQMVRNYYGGIGKERSVTRKLKEIMVALKVGREKPKDWILEQYLNTIYFGRDAYGVQAAAKAYYGQDISELTPAQGAYLAAAIQQPSNFAEPRSDNRAYAEQRWRSVVDNMVENGAITQAEASRMQFPLPKDQKITDILKGQKGYMVNVAKKELIERRGYSEDEINRNGLKITTTFDKRLMDAAKEAVESNAPDGMSKKIRTGMVSVDPKTGQVVAFYGGRGYLEEALSSSFGDWAQPGSGFKPIVLAAALDDGMKLYDSVDGSSPQYYNGTPVRNNDGRSFGQVNLVGATQNSVNTAYVNIGKRVGLDKVTRMAEKMGYSKSQLTANGANTAPTFPLGVISVHPVQQAAAYATFASEGIYREPFVVKSVTAGADHTREFKEKGERVFSAQVARDATYAMSQVVRAGTGTGAQLPDGRDVAGKTGTTDKGRAIWFNGFIPQMATSVGMFRSDRKPLEIPGYGAYGGQLPAQMWRSYTSQAVDIEDISPESFGSPSSRPGGYSGQRPDRSDDPEPTRPEPDGPPDSYEPDRPPTPPTPDDPGPDLPTLPPGGDPDDPPGPGDPGPGDPGGGGGGGGGRDGSG